MRASDTGHLECVKELLVKGAQVNIQDKVSDAKYLLLVTWHSESDLDVPWRELHLLRCRYF